MEQLPQRHIADITCAPSIDVTEDSETWFDVLARPSLTDEQIRQALKGSIDPTVATAEECAELCEDLLSLHTRYPGLFDNKLTHAGRANVTATIETTRPVQPQPRRPIMPRYQAQLQAECDRMREAGFTRRVDAREAMYTAANHVIKDKPNGGIRVTTDRTELNKVAVRDAAPTAAPMKMLDRAAAAQFFSSLDLTEAFYQISGAPLILSMLDPFSGTTFVERATTRTADETAALLVKRVLLGRSAVPQHWQSDNGSEFVGKVMKAMARIMGIDNDTGTPYHDTGTPYHPQTQGSAS